MYSRKASTWFTSIFMCLCFASGAAYAEVYKYIDSEGQVHYVNDPTKVPSRYQDQVISNIELPKLGRYQSFGKKLPPGQTIPALTSPATTGSKKIEVLVTSWCPYCKKLEKFLKEQRISYVRYDVEHDAKGMQIHNQLGGGGVPVTRIGSTVLRGFNPDAILQALGKK